MLDNGGELMAEAFTLTFTVEKSPDEVFDAINNVRGWWSGQVSGETDRVGAEFSYRYAGVHHSRQRVTELLRGKRIVWHVFEAELSFVADPSEWKGTDIVFETAAKGRQTEVRFSHVGLHAKRECYANCSSAWSLLVSGNLRRLIDTGTDQPDALA